MPLPRLPRLLLLALVAAAACRATNRQPASAASPPLTADEVRTMVGALAADSMEGRRTGTAGAARAARYIAGALREAGVQPAGDSGDFLQRIQLARVTRPSGRMGWVPVTAELDTVPPERRASDQNVVAVVRGSDPALRDRAIVVGAHYDHVGIGPAVNGDSLYNGADDNASGVVTMLGVARALARGPAPRRTVVFVAFTGEEMGGAGRQWYIQHPVVPLDRTDLVLVVEMVGRPDSAAGGAGRAWLTGFERSTLGETLAARGLAVVADPHPQMSFFTRSDNIAFARLGIVSHALSSYGLHTDYHRPSDEPSTIDAEHMAQVVATAARAVRILADADEAPAWKPGGRP